MNARIAAAAVRCLASPSSRAARAATTPARTRGPSPRRRLRRRPRQPDRNRATEPSPDDHANLDTLRRHRRRANRTPAPTPRCPSPRQSRHRRRGARERRPRSPRSCSTRSPRSSATASSRRARWTSGGGMRSGTTGVVTNGPQPFYVNDDGDPSTSSHRRRHRSAAMEPGPRSRPDRNSHGAAAHGAGRTRHDRRRAGQRLGGHPRADGGARRNVRRDPLRRCPPLHRALAHQLTAERGSDHRPRWRRAARVRAERLEPLRLLLRLRRRGAEAPDLPLGRPAT